MLPRIASDCSRRGDHGIPQLSRKQLPNRPVAENIGPGTTPYVLLKSLLEYRDRVNRLRELDPPVFR
jgi:hypothetical protein